MMRRMRVALLALSILVFATVHAASAGAAAPQGTRAKPDKAAIEAAAAAKAAVAEKAARELAAADFAAAQEKAQSAGVKALIAKLARARVSSDDERRAVLARFHAAVPDKLKGTFVPPPRQKGKPPPDPDWLEELSKMDPHETAVAETLADVQTIRALADSKEEAGADAILDFAFSPDGSAFRDECGRRLREMAPWSLPTLLRASQRKKRAEGYSRYAVYQLDRLDKARPSYALEAAPTDTLEAQMLRAIRDVKHPDAVTAVLDRVDSPSHTVRRAAREAWLAYVTGPPPPPAPKAKRKLPGGRLTDEEMPLYLTYREFATNEIRRVLGTINADGTLPDEKLSAEELTTQLFALYDQRRAGIWDAEIKQAHELAAAGKWIEVAARYDAILTDDPTYARRSEMVEGYLAAGRAHAKAGEWDQAMLTFHKAVSIDPAGPHASEAEGEFYLARSMRTKAAGGDGDADLARAQRLNPGLASVREAMTSRVRARSGWMLYAGVGTGALALALVVVAWRIRRRT